MDVRKKIIIALLLISALNCSSFGQVPAGQKDKYTLLTMPYNLRQLTLYRGQFTINAGYKFAVRSLSYDENGEKVVRINTGSGSVYHYYFADIRYGLTNFLELGAETNFIRRGMRAETSTYTSATITGTSSITVNKLTEMKGLGDILLLATLRPPVEYRWIDFSITGGLFLPSSKYKPEKPTDIVTNVTAADSYTVNYHYNYTNGYGVPVYLMAGTVKAGIKKFTFQADLTFKTPKKEGTSIRWEENLANQKFSYNDKSYKYLLSNSWMINCSLHFQATGWFDLFLEGSWLKTIGGWTEYWGNKYKNPETRLLTVEPGFELQISPSLTIYQVAGFPLSGKNSDAPFYLFTTVRFSNFIFSR